jgi:type IV secretory pathway VirB10-like protein
MPDPNMLPDSQQPPGGEVRDRSIRPTGLLPKNAQTYVTLAIAAIMIGAIAFSGGGNSSKQPANAQPKTAAVIDPNLARIQDYRNRIDEEARKLAAEQAQLEQTKQALGLPPLNQTNPARGGAPVRPAAMPPGYSPPPTRPEKSALESEKEKREYQSLFASNIALTYRTEGDGTAELASAPAPQQTSELRRSTTTAAVASPQGALLYSWPYAAPAAVPALPAPAAATTAPRPELTATGATAAGGSEYAHEPDVRLLQREHIDPSLQKANGKTYRLFEGAIIETVLTNRLESSFNGPVNCLVTTDAYSHDDQHVLIPKGTRVLGEVKRNDSFGQQRLAVVFHRLIMPDGYSVSLDQFKGLSQIGETGLRDQLNHHYNEIFGVSLAIGAIAGLSHINTTYGLSESGLDAYRQGVSASLSQSSLRILDKYLNILPTFTIREGQRIKVILSDDLMLPAYDRHKIPSDL